MKTKIRLSQLLVIGCFFGFFLFCLVWGLAQPDRPSSAAENRSLAQRPAMRRVVTDFGGFAKDFESYAADQFPDREQLIGVYTALELAQGKKFARKAYCLQGGWLLTKPTPTKPVDLSALQQALAQAGALDRPLVWCVLPLKNEALYDLEPAYFSDETGETNKQALTAALAQVEGLTVIDAEAPLVTGTLADRERYFYKTDFHDFFDPITSISVHAEGALTYDALLFIPSRTPYDFYSKDYEKGLALYSSNVLIQEKCAELLPDYYSFVRGVVDSQDLTLNISRETLQHNSQLRAIANKLEKKITSELGKMRDNDRETYEKFFENFGRNISYGIYSSYGMKKDTLADLLLYYSAKQKKMITLKEYVEAMPEDQKSIFYAAGESVDRLARRPIVNTVLGKGYDVLLCPQDVDEFCLTSMNEYDEKQFKNVAGGDLGLETEDEKSAAEAITKENEELFNAMKDALDGKVKRVAVSSRLSDTPSCVTAPLKWKRFWQQAPTAIM